ncbi:rSAM-associated Gly-rich repeat protein [Synechococcus sp. HJ21-Hayes]|jgi:rSAM-associated Gly-rich repeat protein|uniref:GrrA/OscA1 family cyclophane-containing rSAM-modified RiPP n=1 Tax=unclassified Synechococcus TaxID=2626047 RepID=UPI0020CB715F|nr:MULTISPECIES: GrrA/OscA1 family cyclophane-containing rSAM-modified RiPP [unclassified Synechococcus]MCP9830494.1 rSAM-associated Gly-rich repeat protein [Synechococcus sp. JJ3a-Johnson]MCP9852315.1 rSAM-associated Gly-rich repeat protein [Synechococcus sp. HJ21-Hayes]
MALFNRSHLFGLLLLVSLPLDGAAALALASVQDVPASRSIEERLSRIAAAVQEREGSLGAAEGPTGVADDALSYVFVNGSGLGWGNGGFNNGGFYNGGFDNGGFTNGGFYNGGFRNGGFRNGGFFNGGRYWR